MPRSLPDQVRADVRQDMLVDLVSGEIAKDDVAKSLSRYIARHYKKYDNRFHTVSGTENQKWADLISSQHDVWR